MPLEITLAIADLIEALKNNNLEETIKLTNYLNNNINFINEELNQTLFGNGNFPIIQESFDYILENALFLKDVDIIIFRRKIKKIIKNNNIIEIEKFISDLFSNSIPENWICYKNFYNDLLTMGNLVNNDSIYLKIKEYIQQKGEIN